MRYGTFTALSARLHARGVSLSRKALSSIWHGYRVASAQEAVAILGDPEIQNASVTFQHLTGVVIPPGTRLADGIVSAPAADAVDPITRAPR